MMDKLSMQSKNLADENYKKLIELFPNIVTETVDEEGNVIRAIDKDKLEMELATKVVEGSEERYQFTWPDKKKSVIASNAPTTNTLRPSREDSVNFDQTENLYIEGDNLEVLKVLKETYNGKVKMIYIDPPYNTGKDFVYSDNFTESIDEYVERSGDFDEEGNRLVKNLDSNGRFHTDWLNMIYPRLKLARNLLSDDGVIFISIDDNEQANLKKVCDEIFGEQNFIATFIWEKTAHFGRQKINYYSNSEYVLSYAKNLINDTGIKELLVEKIKTDLEDAPLYNASNPLNILEFPKESVEFNISDGTYMTSSDNKFELLNSVCVKNGVNTNSFKIKMRSRWSSEKVIEELNNGCKYLVKSDKFSVRVYYNADKASKESLKQIIFTNKNNPLCAYDRFSGKVNTNNEASKSLESIFGSKIFDYSKPASLVKYFASSLWNDLDKEFADECIILDFFSGSATTAEAVMQLNAEDGGKRKYIMVQLSENLDVNLNTASGELEQTIKNGIEFLDSINKPHLLTEIGKERIRRAAKKIKEDYKDKEGIENLDTGFRVLKLDTSNMRDVYYNPADIELNVLENQIDNVKDDRNEYDLLFQVMLDFGIELSSAIEEVQVDSGKYFSVADGFLCASFDDDIDTDLVKAMAKSKASYAIFKDSSFKKDSDRINLEQIFNELSPNTEIKVI